MAIKDDLKKKFAAIPPKNRLMVIGVGVFAVLAIVAVALGPTNKPTFTPKKMKDGAQTVFSTPGGNKDLSFEKLAAQVAASKQETEKVVDKNNDLEKKLAQTAKATPPGQAEILAELKKVKEDLENTKKEQQKKPSLDDEIPSGSGNSSSSSGGASVPGSDYGSGATGNAQPEREQPMLRVIGGAPKPNQSDQQVDVRKPIVYLPPGANFEGILLNGMDAPTSAITKKNPVPALLRVKSDAILPNRSRFDVKECFVIVSGHGVLSTERAELQVVSLSCIKTDGSVVDTKMEGYVVGEDGKVGMRGRLVTKQGAIIAKSLIAGFASGFGAALTPTAVPQLNVNPGSTAQYQMPDMGNAAMAGAAQGISASAKAISQFYLEMAREMFPVVEIDAARRVTIILIKGVEINVSGGKP